MENVGRAPQVCPGRSASLLAPEPRFDSQLSRQNLLLQAVALDLGGVPAGSFDDSAVCRLLELPDGEKPRYRFALGRPA